VQEEVQEPKGLFGVKSCCSTWPPLGLLLATTSEKQDKGLSQMSVEAVLGITLGVTAITLLGTCYAACQSVDSELREESHLFRMRERRGLWLGK